MDLQSGFGSFTARCLWHPAWVGRDLIRSRSSRGPPSPLPRRTRPPSAGDRPVVLFIGADGTVIHDRTVLTKFPADQSLKPFASVETHEEATALTVLRCETQLTANPLVKDRPWYTYRPFEGNFEAFQKAANDFEAYYQSMRNRRPPVDVAA
jgi:hypothetical protein